MARDKTALVDATFAVRAVEDLVALFGKPPRAYAYDRAGGVCGQCAALGLNLTKLIRGVAKRNGIALAA